MWLRRLREICRHKISSLDPLVAAEWKTKMSALHLLVGWNFIGFSAFYIWKQNYPNMSGAADYAKFLGLTESKVVNIQGVQIGDSYDISFDESGNTVFHNMENEEEILK